jgi:Mg2+/Co2+ transporter CorB
MSVNTSVPVLSLQDLIQLSQKQKEHIEEIKNEVAQEVHNLNDTKPLFDQLSEDK